MIRSEEVTGLILAGGGSRRMGNDKALLLWDDRPFIVHIADALLAVFDQTLLSANDPERYAFLGLPVVPDFYPGAGPLAGLHAACLTAATPYLFVTPCDAPQLSPDFIRALLMEAEPDAISVYNDQQHLQPLIGIYPCSIAAVIEARLQQKKLSVLAFLAEWSKPIKKINLPVFASATLNINTPEAYCKLISGNWNGSLARSQSLIGNALVTETLFPLS